MLLDAAVRVIARNGYSAATVSAVLAEAGLSTRAFYRHFDSNQALLRSVQEREMAFVERTLERAVGAADGPVAAVEAWLTQFLDLYYEPWRAVLMALFCSPSVDATYRAGAEGEMRERFCRPLIRVLRAGNEAGVLQSPVPETDAYCLHALVGAAAASHHADLSDRSAAKAQVLRYARSGLGLPPAAEPTMARTARSKRAQRRG